MWARYGVFLVTLTCLVAMVTMEIPKPMVSLEKMEENSNGIYTEKCWPDRSKCVNRSAQGSGLRWEKCWLR